MTDRMPKTQTLNSSPAGMRRPKARLRFDIDQHLKLAYDEMSREEVPERLRVLLERLRDKTLETTRQEE